MQYLVAFFSRPEAAGDVISNRFVGLIVYDKHVKFHNPRLNHSREIPPKAVGGGGIFNRFFNFKDNCQPEVASDVISGMAFQYVSIYACQIW